MRSNYRLLCNFNKIPEALIGKMRNVKNNTELVTKLNNLFTLFGKTCILSALVYNLVTASQIAIVPSQTEDTNTEVIELAEYFGVASKTCRSFYGNKSRMLALSKCFFNICIACYFNDFVFFVLYCY